MTYLPKQASFEITVYHSADKKKGGHNVMLLR